MSPRHALLCALLMIPSASAAWAAPAGPDVERVAVRAAQALNGVLRGCPASFTKIGTDAKTCVGVGGTVEEVRVTLGAAFSGELYGVWRSRDGQLSVFNWVATPAGHVYLRVQPDPDGRVQTLVYVDVPPDSPGAVGNGMQLGSVTLMPAPAATGTTAQPSATMATAMAGAAPDPAAGPAPSTGGTLAGTGTSGARPSSSGPSSSGPSSSGPSGAVKATAPVPFRRTLSVTTPRMSGADVLAVQNRLISLTRPARAGRGDGWFGPVTAGTVRAFQGANSLPVTGVVNQATWDALFTDTARPFRPLGP